MTKTPPLSIVTLDAPKPPRQLGMHGQRLWASDHREYDVSDCAGVEMLAQACAAADHAEQLREAINADGPVIRTRNGIKDHPALKHELANRAFVVRTLSRLGLNYEPLRSSPGRPPGAP